MMNREKIDSMLQAEDIEGLIGIGAPTDEYVGESLKIFLGLENLETTLVTLDDILSVIRQVWRESFDLREDELAKREDAFRRVALEISSEWSTNIR
jgi:hypothetical protein